VRRKGEKPQMLVCYLCGQQFGSASLGIHAPQCYQKKMIDWQRAEPGKRGPKPKDPATVDLTVPMSRDEFNNQQFSQFTENLAQCHNCGRKFLADRLEVHLRSCKPGAAGASKPVGARQQQQQQQHDSSLSPLQPGAMSPALSGRGGGGSATSTPSASASPYRPLTKLTIKQKALRKLVVDDLPDGGLPDAAAFHALCRRIDAGASDADMQAVFESLDANVNGLVDGADVAAARRASAADTSANPLRNRMPTTAPAEVLQMRSCDGCGAALQDDDAFCGDCGHRTDGKGDDDGADDDAGGMLCRECGEVFTSDAKFCEECGGPLEALARQPAAAESPSKARLSAAISAGRSQPQPNEYEEEEPQPMDDGDDARVSCAYCNRRFMPDAIHRHEGVCAKTSQKKRRVFDSSAARVKGTDMAQFARAGSKAEAPKPVAQWRQKSDDFRNAMRQARNVTVMLAKGVNVRDLPPPTYSANPHYVPCPYCNRTFAPETAARHIPKCKDTINKPKAPPKRPGALRR
jgi:hypothetical protein